MGGVPSLRSSYPAGLSHYLHNIVQCSGEIFSMGCFVTVLPFHDSLDLGATTYLLGGSHRYYYTQANQSIDCVLEAHSFSLERLEAEVGEWISWPVSF
jgi:hypothetical protein